MHAEIGAQNLEYVTEQETEPVVVQKHRLSSIMPIIIFSFIGVLIRLGLAFLGNNQTPLNAAFWPNFVGCFIMGFVVEQKIHIQNQYAFTSICSFHFIFIQFCSVIYGFNHWSMWFNNNIFRFNV
jgi:hypothetical protein